MDLVFTTGSGLYEVTVNSVDAGGSSFLHEPRVAMAAKIIKRVRFIIGFSLNLSWTTTFILKQW